MVHAPEKYSIPPLMNPTPYWCTLREETRRVVQEAERQRSQELENRTKQEKVTFFSPVPKRRRIIPSELRRSQT